MRNWLLGSLLIACMAVTAPCFAAKRRAAGSQKINRVAETGIHWMSYQDALNKAKQEGKHVAVFFTGSDWCIWCMRMQDQILQTAAFSEFAKQYLCMVEIDFPHNKEQTAEQKEQNRHLKSLYSVDGFPTLVFLDSEGKEVAKMGFEPGGGEAYVYRLKQALHIS
ncbi:thioredoxin family protein [Chlamydia trachomatis]|uniref:Protein disulfide isomerase n=2 Tax=Chlamydia trachomatis TaxID=813 RepID=A0A6H2W0S0_CHLTB|nr:disulfide reductase DsbH [Chlamydia trachomatis]AEJ77068.1 protein disulfide isomerase [Chlamydia trachomatis L2c]AGJ64241.1 Disulfide bond reductase DsbH [Chlamydia trachomatis L2/434/Bu(i)]AGJ65181.1 Disulfide bond reductase DsbH [Chlamydia trachomatis L2/434/Bu(f)]AGR94228.1 protein disulfide isomerase [Chlamydia trachomatis RC-F/69]AGR95154.1 protein disulfide isomerase [Chlamydia trachomatis RC-L2(s)/46]